MGFFQNVGIALDMLRQHKLRALLTMLGVIIGVMSVTMIILISNGFQAYISNQFEKLGANTLFIFFDPGRRGRGQTTGGVDKLTTDDMKFVMNRVQLLDLASGITQISGQTALNGSNKMDSPTIYATDENFRELNHFNMLQGRAISADDVKNRANVCVIGDEVRDRLFPNQDSIGKMVVFNGIALQVIGVIEPQTFLGNSTSKDVLVPLTTAQKKWVGGNSLNQILLRAKPGVKIDVAMQQVWEALMLRSHNRAIYRVDSNESIMNVFGGILGVAGGILAGVAALSLLVGGIGIMNIMLVSVTERTKEIGLRKAIGARRSAVLTQFLIEAATLSLVGGLIGMGLAWGLGEIVSLVSAAKDWPAKGGLTTPFPVFAGIMAALFSAAIGMVFGFYPAMTASKLDPIVALRTGVATGKW